MTAFKKNIPIYGLQNLMKLAKICISYWQTFYWHVLYGPGHIPFTKLRHLRSKRQMNITGVSLFTSVSVLCKYQSHEVQKHVK